MPMLTRRIAISAFAVLAFTGLTLAGLLSLAGARVPELVERVVSYSLVALAALTPPLDQPSQPARDLQPGSAAAGMPVSSPATGPGTGVGR